MVPTLEREEEKLSIPAGTQTGSTFRIKGRGISKRGGPARGDLYVTVRVEIPRGIDARTQELFRELGRLLPRQEVRP